MQNVKLEIFFLRKKRGNAIYCEKSKRRPGQFVIFLDLKNKVALCSKRQNGSYLMCFLMQPPKKGQCIEIVCIGAKSVVGVLVES